MGGFENHTQSDKDRLSIRQAAEIRSLHKKREELVKKYRSAYDSYKTTVDDLTGLHEKRLKEWHAETEGRVKNLKTIHRKQVDNLIKRLRDLQSGVQPTRRQMRRRKV